MESTTRVEYYRFQQNDSKVNAATRKKTNDTELESLTKVSQSWHMAM